MTTLFSYKRRNKPASPVLAAALFTIARTQKQRGCPSAHQWIKMRYLYSMEYYSAVERNMVESLAVMWIILEPVILSKSEREKQISLYINVYIYGI